MRKTYDLTELKNKAIAIKALAGLVNHLIDMTTGTGSPILFINWIKNIRFRTFIQGEHGTLITGEKLKLNALFVDYKNVNKNIRMIESENIISSTGKRIKKSSFKCRRKNILHIRTISARKLGYSLQK